MAEEIGVDELRVHALATIGLAKRDLGDPSGDEDTERALEIALEIDSPLASTIVNNLAVRAFFEGRLDRADELYAEGLRLAIRFGDGASARFIRANQVFIDFMRGKWDTALADADAFIAECETGSPHAQETNVRIVRGMIRKGRGDSDGALADHQRAVVLARESAELSYLVGALAQCIATHAERGELAEARELTEELMPALRKHGPHGAINSIAHLAEQLGVLDELRQMLDKDSTVSDVPWIRAARLAVEGDFRAAADVHAAVGSPTNEANRRFHAGERLLAQGEAAEAEEELEKSLAFYRGVGATYFIDRTLSLLGKSAYSDSA